MKRILVFIALGIFINLKAQVCFNPITTYSSGGSQPVSICSADFNQDGKLDLATSNDNAASISIYLGNGFGAFAAPTNFASGSAPYSIMSADFNADGKPDLVTANGLSNNVSVFLGTGTGSFSPAINYATGGWPSDICSADFNNDGKLDLASTNNTGNSFSILLGTGIGTFSTAINYSSGGSGPLTILTGDFNSDSKFDLVITNRLSSNIAVFLGTGSGTFSAAVTYSTPSLPTGGFAADFNSDNILDIVSVGNTSTLVTVFLGTGTGSFSPSTNYPSPIFQTAISTDFNMDGKKDIAGVGGNYLSVLLGTGTGSFVPATIYSVGVNTNESVSGDFDANGKNDIAVTNYNSNSITVLLNSIPSISISSSGIICNGSTATLSATGANTYSWSNNATGSLTTVSPSINTTYTLVGTTTTGCTYLTSKSITVNPTPTLTLAGTNAICTGNTASLSIIGASTYSWSTSSTSSIITVAPSVTTIYSVTGTGTNGCSVLATKVVTVNSLPTLTISGPNSICIGNTASLSITGASSYSWSNSSTSSNIAVSPTVTSSYSVLGTDANGCSVLATKVVTVNALPTLTISGPNSICIGNTASLSISGASSYSWSTSSTSTNIAVSPTVTSSYSVLGTDANGCSNIASKSVTVNALPSLTITGSSATCLGGSTALFVFGALNYTWSTASTSSNVFISPSITTIYSVIGSDINGCTSSIAKTVTVNALPSLTISGSTVMCLGNTITLTASGAPNYTWSNNSNQLSIAVSPSITTNYSVIGKDANGCVNSSSKTITVNQLPNILVSSSRSLICIGETTTLNVSGAQSFTWNTNQNTPSISISPTVNTTYSVIGIDANGCLNSTSIVQTVSNCSGINSFSKRENPLILIYPNPNNGAFKITSETEMKLEIINNVGQTIKKIYLNSENNLKTEISDLKTGIYFVINYFGNEIQIQKIVVY